MRVVAFAPDLMDQSKIRAAGIEIVRSLADLPDVQADRLLRVYAFNATPRTQRLTVSGLPSPAWRRSFRGGLPVGGVPSEATGRKLSPGGEGYTLELEPHDIVALDAEVDAHA